MNDVMQLEIADARTPKKVSTTSIWFDRGRKRTAEPAEPAERGPKGRGTPGSSWKALSFVIRFGDQICWY